MIKNQNVYVSVGGKGGDGKVLSRAYGGWNGGGDGESDQQDDEAMAGGGGCTSIQISLKSDGQLKNYASVKNTDVLIVAGGGGGGYTSNYGRDDLINQYGGGSVGAKAWYNINGENHQYTEQATQTSGYAFGQGQSAPTTVPANSEIPGGGGGWYGGYTVIPTVGSTYAVAGGGSGYIGTMLSNGTTIAGNQTIPSPTGGTEIGHSDNGYCKITWHPAL